jgi:IclR family acetate operon transcriptional repressor
LSISYKKFFHFYRKSKAPAMEQAEKRQRGRPRAFSPSPDAGPVQSLDRALRILAIVARASGLSLSEIADQSGIAAATAYRMLTTLEAHGMVEFDRTEQLWSIGVETYRMGSAFLRGRKIGPDGENRRNRQSGAGGR